MIEGKTIRVRAIILHEENFMTMYREYKDRKYYTFPGGGLEGDESEEECVKRECEEEFGIVVKPIKKVYIYDGRSEEHFYLCSWVSGEFGSGKGEEFSPDNKYGLYKPCMKAIKDIPNLPLMPKEVAQSFYQDYNNCGKDLRDDVRILSAEQN